MGFSPLLDQSSGYQGGSEASCFYDDTKKKRTNIKLSERRGLCLSKGIGFYSKYYC